MDSKFFETVPDISTLWPKLVEEKPDEVIIVEGADASTTFTRKAVDNLSAKVRAWLKAQSIGREDMVMIALPRGAAALISMLGIWKAGAAFVVVEANYPKDRIEYIKKDGNVKAVIDIDAWMEIMEVSPLYGFEPHDIHDATFAVYTSGSTGRPKGVLHEYGTLKMNHACGICKNQFELNSDFRTALTAPFSFVASVKVIMVTFTIGMIAFVLPFEIIKNPLKLKMYLIDNQITSVFLPPSLLRSVGTDFGPYIKFIICSSEPAGGVEPGATLLFNTYVMSETAFTVGEFIIDQKYDVCPVGVPNTDILGLKLLDEDGNEVPAGESGEICFNNPFFRGYIGLDEETETAKRGGIFHSGDLGRFDENGNLVLTGRNNDMVKINGNRVEPSEIEAVAKSSLPIKDCIVKGFIDPKRTFLCLYYMADQYLSAGEAREVLSENLPYYMIPSYFIRLDSFPRLPNGKLDKKSLKAPKAGTREAYVAPRNDIEKRICQAMAHVLGIARVGVFDDFYDIGGDSLSSMSVLAETGLEDLNAMDIFMGRTVDGIARLYEENRKNRTGLSPEEYEQKARQKVHPLTVAQLDIFDRQLYNPKETMWNLPQMFVTSRLEDADKLKDALNKVIKNHPVFSMGLEFGEDDLPVQRYDESYTPVVEIEDMTEEEFAAERNTMVGLHKLMHSSLFEVRLIRTEAKLYVFFNPHHIMIDGMGYQALFTNVARAYKGQELIPDTYCTYLSREEEIRDSEKYIRDMEFWQDYYSGKDWCRELIPDQESTENLMNLLPIPVQVSVKDAEKFEAVSKLSRNGLFSLAAMMALSEVTGRDDIMIAWAFHNRTDVSRMRAVGLLIITLPLGISFSEFETFADLYEEIRKQSALGIEHNSYEMTKATDNAFEADTLNVVYETAAIADQGALAEIGLKPGQDTEEAVNNNKAALQNFAMLVYEFPEVIQPIVIYSKSLFSDELMERYSDAFVDYLHKIIGITDPEHTRVSDLMETAPKEEQSGISPDTRVRDLAKAYPWMESRLPEFFPDAEKHLKNPLSRRVLMGMKLGALANQMGQSFEELLGIIQKLIKENA